MQDLHLAYIINLSNSIRMSTSALCRVCLASNTKMHNITNTPYQEILEKIATEVCTADGTPETVCWVCFSALQRCWRLADMARAAHEILTQLSLSGIPLNKATVSILDRTLVRKLARTPIQSLSINERYKHSPSKVEIKEEPTENDITNVELCDETQVLNKTQAEMNYTQALLMLTHTDMDLAHTEMDLAHTEMDLAHTDMDLAHTEMDLAHTEMDLAQEKQTVSQEKDKGCQTIYDIKQEPLNYDEVVEPNCSKTQRPVVEKCIGKKAKNKKVGMRSERLRRQPADIKQETLEIPAEFEVPFTHRHEESPKRKLKKPKQSYETLVTDRDGQARVKHGCPRCANIYKHRCHLLRHIRMHNEGTEETSRNFCCETCGKAFHTRSVLEKHSLSHTGEKRYLCDHCPTKCSQKIDMERHMAIHMGHRPYQCDQCKQKFNRKGNMQIHILTHMVNKRYRCQICHIAFSRKYNLSRHNKRRHVGEKPYACNICQFRSGNASYMKTHMAKMHLKPKGEKPYV